MDNATLAITYLGRALIAIIIGVTICFLASQGYNIYIKYQTEHKKVEVKSKDSNTN